MSGLRHSEETKRKIGAGNRGKTRSLELRAQIAESVAQAQRNLGYHKSPTYIEVCLNNLLEIAGFAFEPQKSFGRYTVDAYVQSHHLVFEADGRTHQFAKVKARDQVRDANLLKMGVLAVIRLRIEDLREFYSR